jgi:hypothetical protein
MQLLGNAGPSKGDANAILELFFALAPKKIIVEEFNFGQPKVIDRAVIKV